MREGTGTEDPGSSTAVGRGRLPNFLIIGAMRSGTTSLTRSLRPHPDVFVSKRKELHFFDFRYEEGIESYRTNFEGSGDVIAVGEATPNYMYDSLAMDRIAGSIPNAHLVAILRDPVDRAYSHYWHNRSVGRESMEFGEALAAEAKRLSTDEPRARAHWSYADRGFYYRQLIGICERFPREALLVLLFDDLRDSPGATYRALCSHLGIREDFEPERLGVTANSFVAFRSMTMRRLTRRLPNSTRRIVGRVNTKATPSYPPMDHSIRSELRDRFRAANALLGGWLGRDLSSWDR